MFRPCQPTWVTRLILGALICCLGLALPAPGKPSAPQKILLPGMNAYIIHAVNKMPAGGGYSTSDEAFHKLRSEALVWNESLQRLVIRPSAATPSFCSEACYLVLLQALSDWEKRHPHNRLPPSCWKKMAVSDPQPDGQGPWGCVNANGPGLAKWIHDLGAGINFSNPGHAKPGDFLKIFWTEEIGAREFGHLVVFIAYGKKPEDGTLCIRFWSSNKDKGYSVNTVPMDSIKRMIFTRITNPAAFRNIDKLPETDEWLAQLLSVRLSPEEMKNKCRIQ